MIRVFTLAGGKLHRESTVAAVAKPADGGRSWIEVVQPSPEEIRLLQERFDLHELALEDALAPGHPPKVEEFDDHLFLIAHALCEDGVTRKAAIFLGKNWIVTMVRKPLSPLDGATAEVEAAPARYFQSPDFLAHHLLDAVLDSFAASVSRFVDRVDELEGAATEGSLKDPSAQVIVLHRELISLSRIARDQEDMLDNLASSTHPVLSKKVRPFLQDVLEHAHRVQDHLNYAKESLTFIRYSQEAMLNNRLNQTMRALTVIATLMMPLSLLAGIYGMNFAELPGSDDPRGFWILLGIMALLAFGMLLWFRRRDWI